MSVKNRKFGWKRDLPDFRERKFNYQKPKDQEIVAAKFNITAPVMDQLGMNGCVFAAITSHMEAIQAANRMEGDWFFFSSLFAYYQYREEFADIEIDDGAYIRVAANQIFKKGVCRAGLWPIREDRFAARPSKEAWDDAQNHNISSHHAITGRDEDELREKILTRLSSGYGFVVGLTLFDSFMSNQVADNGVVPMPKRSEKIHGGHAVYIHSHSLLRDQFDYDVVFGQNSWGTDWGRKGHLVLPLDYLLDDGLDSDFRAINMIKGE